MIRFRVELKQKLKMMEGHLHVLKEKIKLPTYISIPKDILQKIKINTFAGREKHSLFQHLK